MSNKYITIKSGEWHADQKNEEWGSYREIKVINDISDDTIIYRIVLCDYVKVTSSVDPESGETIENVEYVKERNDIYNPKIRELTLLSPSLTMEVNTPGSLEFIMLPDHKFYDKISPMVSTIEVYENDDLIWFGRPTEVEKDFYNQKKVYCEGALGYFNDSVVPAFGRQTDGSNYDTGGWEDNFTLYGFIDWLLEEHIGCMNNTPQIMEARYQFIKDNPGFKVARTDLIKSPPVLSEDIGGSGYTGYESVNPPRIYIGQNVFTRGKIDIENKNINPLSTTQYAITMNIINDYLLDPFGGYIVIRREPYDQENYINYFDWYKDFPLTDIQNEDNQPVEFGLNLLDVSYKFSGGDFCTSVIPIGPSIDEKSESWLTSFSDKYPTAADPDIGWGMTVKPMNYGYDGGLGYVQPGVPYVDSEAVKTYGRIIRVEQFEDDVKNREELLEKAQKYLEDTQFNSISIECSAADLHYQNGNYNKFKLGQVIHIKSTPHLIDRDFPISKMTIKLDSAAKQITLGTVPRKTLTKLQEVDQEKFNYQVTDSDSYESMGSVSNDTMYFVY